MAENKRTYTIQINGLKESYENVKSLREALDTLTDTVVNVTKNEEKSSSSKNEMKSSTDALAKATQKLNEYDRSYETELALINKELSDNKKEIRDAIKIQEAQATVEAKQLDTYRDKQQYLSALNTLIRNHSTATAEDNQAIEAMMQESAALQQQLKDVDAQMKIYTRNVGNYPGAAQMVVDSHKSLKQELRELKAEMAEMLANGVSKTDEAYLKLAERAGQLKDAMSDANQDITNFASDTRGLTNAINLATSAVNVYQLYNSALQVFGNENEDAAKAMQKMMAVMTLLNSLQQVQNSLLSNGSATARLYTKSVELIQAALGLKKTATEADIATTEASTVAQETNTVAQEANAVANEANATSTGTATAAEAANTGAVTANTTATNANTVATNSMSAAQKAGAVASKTLSVALRAIPLMAVIGLVMALIQNWESIWNWFKKTFPVLDTLSKKFNKFGGLMNAIVTGAKAVAAAVVNWLINPFKTFANVVSKILSGDFAGAMSAAMDGIKNQFKGTADAFKNEIVKGYERGQQEMTATSAGESNKRTKQELAELKIQERNNKTYSKRYIELQKKDFDERRKMAKDNKEELDKIKLEEMEFFAEVEDKKTAYAKSQSNARTAAAKRAAAEAKRAAAEAQRNEEKLRKEREEAVKKTQKDIEGQEKLQSDTNKRYYKHQSEELKLQQKELSKGLQKINEEYNGLLKGLNTIGSKVQEVSEIILEAEQNGTESEVALLNGYMKLIQEQQQAQAELVENNNQLYTQTLKDLEKKVVERKEFMVNQVVLEAEEIRKAYEKVIEELDADVKKLRETNAPQEQIDKAKTALENAKADLKKLLGKYSENLEIYIPVNLDIDNIVTQYDKLKNASFSLTQVIDTMMGVDGALESIYTTAESKGADKLFETFRDLGMALGFANEQTEDYSDTMKRFLAIVTDSRPFEEKKKEIQSFISDTMQVIDISKFGLFSKQASDEIKGIADETVKLLEESYKAYVSQQDKVISYNEKSIKRFQDATRDIKFEPVMQDDVLSKFFAGQIINIDKTKKRYSDLEAAYTAYQKSLEKGSKEREAYEDAWQKKLTASLRQRNLLRNIYGEESEQYKNAAMEYQLLVDQKADADKAYVIQYENVTRQIEELNKKQENLTYDYIQSIADRTSQITNAVMDNVVGPMFDGLGELFSFQLEQAQEALEEVEKLYDKAVEARQESADRMQEINNELKNSEGQNKEALEQRLAEEQVLLVQREETERALAKEKEKREYEVNVAEARQRKFELGQKLIEGLVNTALGVTAALKYGFPMGPIFGSIIAAFGALQTAIIAKQIGNVKMPQKYASGGLIGEQGISRSHSQGGHRIEGTNIEVEGQEWVINKKSSKKYDTLLRAINEDRPGLVQKQVEIIRERKVINNNITKFASGGQINTLAATRAVEDNNQIQAITDLIRQIDFHPTVSVTDINKVNKNLVRVRQYAGSVA